MGTDIHVVLTARQDGRWRAVDGPTVPHPWHDPDGKESGRWHPGPLAQMMSYARHYHTFAILAGVRNGRGFAGVPTASGFVPLPVYHAAQTEVPEGEVLPRGLPTDMGLVEVEGSWGAFDPSPYPEGTLFWCHRGAALITDPAAVWEEEEETYAYLRGDGQTWLGDHDHGWLSLTELVADEAYWRQTVTCIGVVSLREYLDWQVQGAPHTGPSSYSADVYGQSVCKLDPDDMNRWLAESVRALGENPSLTDVVAHATARAQAQGVSLYTRVTWEQSYAEAAGYLYRTILPALRAWADEQRLAGEDVRLLFGFDS